MSEENEIITMDSLVVGQRIRVRGDRSKDFEYTIVSVLNNEDPPITIIRSDGSTRTKHRIQIGEIERLVISADPQPESKINDGGPAFPESSSLVCGNVGETKTVPGMTLRAYLAGRSMQGLRSSLTNPDMINCLEQAAKESGFTMRESIARMAVLDADALIAELEKGGA